MKLNIIAYLTIAILIFIILLQNQCSGPKTPPKETRDTVIVYKHTVDTIPGKTVYLKGKSIKDTVWLKENKPDTTYKGLLQQYTLLGNNHFEQRVFKTDFPIADYGSVTVYDTIKANLLIGSSIITDLNIPVTTITIEKEAPLKTKLYYGITLTGTKTLPINGIFGDLLLQTKKEKIYSLGVGWNGEVTYKGSIYWPLKFNKR